ncbi:MAG: lytic transglycosylase domain-containing protein [Oscillospiraceae bacterium]|nr:lytic transglycosylase domain-containing protein [Oscillospiraceae bacterium]
MRKLIIAIPFVLLIVTVAIIIFTMTSFLTRSIMPADMPDRKLTVSGHSLNPQNSVNESASPVNPLATGSEIEKTENFVYLPGVPLDKELQKYIYTLCEKNNIEYELLLALIWGESRFMTEAVNQNTNGTVDRGLMQINEIHKEKLSKKGIDNLFDPKQNILAGISILKPLLDKYDEKTALMAYQKGVKGMMAYKAQGVEETRAVKNILIRRNMYKTMYRTRK